MKIKQIFLPGIILFINLSIVAQSKCDCSSALSADLLTVNSNYNQTEFREFLYQYFKASKKERRQMKRENSNRAGFGFVVDGLPLEFDAASDSSRDSKEFYAFEQEVLNNNFVSNSILESVATRFMSTNQLNAYKACLESKCETANGVTLEKGGDEFDIFYVRVSYNSPVQDSSIEFDTNVQYAGCTPVYSLVMTKGAKLKSGQDLVQYFKRNSSETVATINVKFSNGISTEPIVLEKKNNNTALPIGSIITSTLTFSEFQSLITDKAFDKTESSWAPCDGRNVDGSVYATKFNKTFTPDLRGQFLRGNFTMGGPSEPEQSTPNGKNPRDKESNKNGYTYQSSEFQSHNHTLNKPVFGHRNSGFPHQEDMDPGNWGGYLNVETDSKGGSETRPMNMYVYYYIRIN